ncbi:MAG TPA: anion permease [Candidatus Collinsella stercoripullorum]|nr:anion permease [Candidatus Collinsella stercoripullorum]
MPCSLIFITGDAVINPLAASYAGGADFVTWFKVMGVPAIIMSVITLVLFLLLFRAEKDYAVDKEAIRVKLAEMGKMSVVEIKTIVWVVLAIVLWLTESIHGIDIGWVTFAVGMLMSMPIVGDLNAAKDWSAVPIHVLVFLTAAMAIGHVGADTGMNAWIASFMPTTVPDNMFLVAAIIVALSFVIHMLLGSVIAVMGVAVPAILAFAEPLGIDPMVATMICYMAVAAHYLFPFQHLNTLVGASPDTGNYTQKETLRLGIVLIPFLFVIAWIMVGWFMIIGLA